jgi:hypothetical protein
LEFVDVGPDAVHDTRDVVARVHGLVEPFGDFPAWAASLVCDVYLGGWEG